MAKLKPGEKRVQLSFQRPEDVRLWAFMEKRAYECRWNMDTFILASLTEAFKERMEEDGGGWSRGRRGGPPAQPIE